MACTKFKGIEMNNIKVFIFAYLQVFFVSLNVYYISKMNYYGVMISSFMVNVLWMLNVSSTSKKTTIAYPIGATLGCVSGMFLGNLLNSIF